MGKKTVYWNRFKPHIKLINGRWCVSRPPRWLDEETDTLSHWVAASIFVKILNATQNR